MKFLTSLIKHSMQPARRADGSTQQAEPFSPLNPMQQSLPIRPDEPPQQSLQQDASATAAPLTQPQREESKSGFATERSASLPDTATSRRMDETQTVSDESRLPDRLVAQHLSLDRPAVHATPATAEDTRSKTPDAQNESEEAPAVEPKPSFPAERTGIETQRVSAQDRVAGEPNELKSESSQISSRVGKAEAVPPLPAAEPEVSKPAEQHSAADLAREENGPDTPAQANPLRKSAPEMDLPANKPQSRLAEDSVRHLQASVQQEQPALRSRRPGPPSQQQSQELPQVRIGQINVLVEDQAPAKPKPRKSSAKSAVSNPFGLRGL